MDLVGRCLNKLVACEIVGLPGLGGETARDSIATHIYPESFELLATVLGTIVVLAPRLRDRVVSEPCFGVADSVQAVTGCLIRGDAA